MTKGDRWFPIVVAGAVLVVFHLRVALTDPGYWTGSAWDEGWYLSIAAGGYHVPEAGYTTQSNVVFGPAWPLLLRLASATSLPLAVARLVLAGLLLFVSLVGIDRLFGRLTSDAAVRRSAVLLFAFAPGSYIWPTGYAEGLFLCLLVWCLLAVVDGRFPTAVLLAAAATSTRSTAVVLVPTLFLAIAAASRGRTGRRLLRATTGVGIAGAGLVAWMALLWVTVGDPFAWLHGYAGWNAARVPGWFNLGGSGPLLALWQACTLEGQAWSALTGTLVFLAIPVLLVLERHRLPVPVLAFAWIAWGFFLYSSSSVGPFTYLNILRHGAMVFPIWLCAASLLSRWRCPPWVVWLLVVCEVFAFQHFVGRFVEERWVS